MKQKVRNFPSPSGRKTALRGLVAALALLLALSLTLSGAKDLAAGPAPGAEAQSAVRNTQHAIRNTQRVITYTYDDAGRLVGADYDSGYAITYTYDAAGNLVGVSPVSSGYELYLPLVLR